MTWLQFNPQSGSFIEVQQQTLATPKQVAYLGNLRRAIGLEKWKAVKTALGIETPGTNDLTMAEASRIIQTINTILGGRDDYQD